MAHKVASSFSAGSAPLGPSSGRSSSLVHDVQLAFAHSTQPVFYAMAGVLAASFLVTLIWLARGRVEAQEDAEIGPSPVLESMGR